jgi:hypothetical protein
MIQKEKILGKDIINNNLILMDNKNISDLKLENDEKNENNLINQGIDENNREINKKINENKKEKKILF